MSSRRSLSLILFAFDEAENIGPVLGELCAWLDVHEPDCEIVFVDDGSRDETLEAARRALAGRRAVCLRHDENRGIGAALKTGVAAATSEWVTFLPADGQIAPDAIATLRDASDCVDVVFSVYDHRDDGIDRKILSFGVRALIQAVHGVRLQSDGPYLFRRSLFDPAQLRPDTFFLNFEFPIRVLGARIPHRIVTIACRPRRAGVSKSTGFHRRVIGVAKDLADLRRRRVRAALSRGLGGPLDP